MRILVVDNNVELCRILREYFATQEDLTMVGEAHDGEQALALIGELAPDVVILDITMPHLDGIGVLERLDSLSLARRPRIIVLTAFGRDDLIARFTELGVDYFML
jgi:two-component system response regulator (stage 0 sporulation protein A)